MATNNYILTITSKGADARYIVSYRNGNFFRLEHKNGKLATEQQWERLNKVVPQKEEGITKVESFFESKGVTYSKVVQEKKESLHKKMMDAHYSFFKDENGFYPAIDGVAGKSLNFLIIKLRKICANDDTEVFVMWELILSNWHKLEEHYAKQHELKQINSNINTIIRQIKDGKGISQARKKANSNANDLRESL